jgi:hypothetical protein
LVGFGESCLGGVDCAQEKFGGRERAAKQAASRAKASRDAASRLIGVVSIG